MRFAPGVERVFSVLTDEQRASFREAMEAQAEKLGDLEQKAREARRDLFETALTDKFEESAFREKALAAAKLEAELTVIRAKALAKMKPPLSAEQIQNLRRPPETQEGEAETQRRRRRPESPRDEHGLPLKDNSATSTNAPK